MGSINVASKWLQITEAVSLFSQLMLSFCIIIISPAIYSDRNYIIDIYSERMRKNLPNSYSSLIIGSEHYQIGNWTTVTSTTAHNSSCLAWNASTGNSSSMVWATFVPLEISTMGQHELFFQLPAKDAACFPGARNASMIVRGAGAYSHVTIDSKSGATSSDATTASPDWRLASTVSEYSDTNLNLKSFPMHCKLLLYLIF